MIALVEAILGKWDWDNPHVDFRYEDLLVSASWVDGTDEEPPTLWLHGPADQEESLMKTAFDSVGQWFSEATNNDACDVEVRVIAAHFEDNRTVPDKWKKLPDAFEGGVIVVARVLDYLT